MYTLNHVFWAGRSATVKNHAIMVIVNLSNKFLFRIAFKQSVFRRILSL